MTLAFVDPATDLEKAWADAKVEIVAHPQLVGASFVNETVSGTLAPKRGLTAQITFRRVPVAPTPDAATTPKAP